MGMKLRDYFGGMGLKRVLEEKHKKSLRKTNINERLQGRSLLAGHGTFFSSKVGGWRLAVDGGWRRLAAIGGWRLVVDGVWQLTVGG